MSVNETLLGMLQNDIKNERKHLFFYLQAASMVRGLHREELGELLSKESLDEHKHVEEFSRLIVQLGGVPNQEINPFPTDLTCPKEIIKYAVEMEQEVADNYASRIKCIETMADYEGKAGILTHVSLFYEDQLQDSQETALELALFLN